MNNIESTAIGNLKNDVNVISYCCDFIELRRKVSTAILGRTSFEITSIPNADKDVVVHLLEKEISRASLRFAWKVKHMGVLAIWLVACKGLHELSLTSKMTWLDTIASIIGFIFIGDAIVKSILWYKVEHCDYLLDGKNAEETFAVVARLRHM